MRAATSNDGAIQDLYISDRVKQELLDRGYSKMHRFFIGAGAFLSLFVYSAASAPAGFLVSLIARADVATYNSLPVAFETRNIGPEAGAAVTRNTQPLPLQGTGSFGEAFSLVSVGSSKKMLSASARAYEGAAGYPPVFSIAQANLTDVAILRDPSGGIRLALIDDPTLYVTFAVHGFLAVGTEKDHSEIEFEARSTFAPAGTTVKGYVQELLPGIRPLAIGWEGKPEIIAEVRPIPELGASAAIEYEFDGYYRMQAIASFESPDTIAFPYQAILQAKAIASGALGFANTDASNTVSIYSITFSDGSTPESHGLELTFASGMQIDFPVSANVPEPSTLAMLSTLMVSGWLMGIAHRRLRFLSAE